MPRLTITRVPLDKDNRMLRAGLGKHEGLWFARVDLWFFGVRLKLEKRA